MDVARLRESFGRASAYGDQFIASFYVNLFREHPELRQMFPAGMAETRGHVFEALARIVAAVDRPGELEAHLNHLGVTHRRFGVDHNGSHYQWVGEAFLATLEEYDQGWAGDVRQDWSDAYAAISAGMAGAARADEQAGNPPWREAVVVSAERPVWDVAVLQVRLETPLPYLPGQSVHMETALRPAKWRWYSPANAPRDDATLEFHVRLLDGGLVSTGLVTRAQSGLPLKLGPAAGNLTYAGLGDGVLLVAGSTGLAPLKAIAEQIAGLPGPPRPVTLIHAALTAKGIYDLKALEELRETYGHLTVVPVVAASRPGDLAEAYAAVPGLTARDCYIAGPRRMVSVTASWLRRAGVPAQQVHAESFGWEEPGEEGGV